jgi:hypothetical protein
MDEWEATTESGTKYRLQAGSVLITPTDADPYMIRPWVMQAAVEDEAVLMVPWIRPQQWMDVTRPVVGRRLYVASKNEWRISTPIATVEDL